MSEGGDARRNGARRRTMRMTVMLHAFCPEARFVLTALVLWRVTHLLVAEDGPFDAVPRLRAALGESQIGRAMDCFYCTSLWLAFPLACLLADSVTSALLLWLALAGAAAWLQQATGSSQPGTEASP